METKTILEVEGYKNQRVNLYLPRDIWKALTEQLSSNKLTVTLRLLYEYEGELELKEEE